MTNDLKESRYEELLDRMKNQVDFSRIDRESAHREGDDILCEALRELGYNELVDEFELIRKWYS